MMIKTRLQKRTVVMFKCKQQKKKYKTIKRKRCFLTDFNFESGDFIDIFVVNIDNCNTILKCNVHPSISLFPFPVTAYNLLLIIHVFQYITVVCKKNHN